MSDNLPAIPEPAMKRLLSSLRRYLARTQPARKARRPLGSTVRLEVVPLERRELPAAGPFAFNPLGLPSAADLGQMLARSNYPVNAWLSGNYTPPAGTSATAAPADANQVFLAAAYQLLLNRPIDQGGLAYWGGQLAALGRPGVVQSIEQSAEGRQVRLQGIYETLLLRAPGPADRAYWGGQMAAGMSPEQVETAAVNSDEFFVRAGDTPWNFLNSLYTLELNRPLDEGGRVYWGTVLAQGASRADIAQAIVSSPEARAAAVGEAFARLLGHAASPLAVGYWVQTGAQDPVIAGVLGSDESLARVQAFAAQVPAGISQGDVNALAGGYLQKALGATLPAAPPSNPAPVNPAPANPPPANPAPSNPPPSAPAPAPSPPPWWQGLSLANRIDDGRGNVIVLTTDVNGSTLYLGPLAGSGTLPPALDTGVQQIGLDTTTGTLLEVRQDGTFRIQHEATASAAGWTTLDNGAGYRQFTLDGQGNVYALRQDGLLVEFRPFGSWLTVSGLVTSYSLAGGQLVIHDWFEQHITDAGVRDAVRLGFADNGYLSRQAMLWAFMAAERDGVVSSSEFDSLETLYIYANFLHMPQDVQYLTARVVLGDPANASTNIPGGEAGNLFAGCDARRLVTLAGKWFLGNDLPVVSDLHGEKPVGYANFPMADGPTPGYMLFNGSPSYLDVYQGSVGDCTLMASIAETAARTSAFFQAFMPNGDGTFSVRFFRNGAPVYVTVNTELPVNSNGQLVYAKASGKAIWVPLLEKAYAQLNASGWLTTAHPGSNSYAALDDGGATTASTALSALSGRNEAWTTVLNAGNIQAALDAGQLVTLQTDDQGGPFLVPDHEYAVLGVNPDGTFRLFNPWGQGGGHDQYPGFVNLAGSDLGRYFVNYAYTLNYV